jgi:CarD family transcriptional regulator
MAQKKKAQSVARATTHAAAKKTVGKATAAVKKPAPVKAKPVAAAAKVVPKDIRKPAATTSGTAPAVKPATHKLGARPVAAAPVAHKTAPPAQKAAPAAAKAGPFPGKSGPFHGKPGAFPGKPAQAAPARAVAAAVKPGPQKISAPVAAQPANPKAAAEKAAAAAAIGPKKPVSQRHGFRASEFIVYPAHGVGRIVGIEEQEIAGMALELFVINFDKEKLTLRVPTGKLASVGMRKLSEEPVVKKAMETLKGRARVKRTMWSRRAQEYVAKINSGDLVSIAEVVRDLYRSEAQPEQSYSERQLYEDALDRMAREIAAVEKLDERGAVQRITEVLSKSARGRRLAAEEAEANSDAETRAA